MAMKPVFKCLVVAGVCAAATVASAHSKKCKWAANPYLGLDYKLSYTQGKNSWKQLLPTNKVNNNGTIFAGVSFHECVAGEVGFTKSMKRTKYSNTAGIVMFGLPDNAGSQQSIKLSYSNWSFDLNGQYPAGDAFAFLGTVGFASVKPKIQATNSGAAINTPITTISGKTKGALRLGVGLQYVQGMFGVRTRVMWENSSNLRVNTGTLQQAVATGGFPNVTNKPFKDTYAWTLGAFVRW